MNSKHTTSKNKDLKHKTLHKNSNDDKKSSFNEEVSVKDTFKQILISKPMNILLVLLLVIGLMSIAYDVRTGAVDYETSWTCEVKSFFNDEVVCSLKDTIEQNINRQIQQLIAQDIQQQYPGLDQQFLQQEVLNQYQQVLDTNTYRGQDLGVIVESQYQSYINNFQSDLGQTYFTGIDPYLYLGYSKNFYINGHSGTTLNENGTPVVEYRKAPEGNPVGRVNLHSYVMSQMYNLNNLEKSEGLTYDDRMNATFTLPAIIAMLTIIPLFFLLKGISNNYFAVIGTLLLTTTSIYLSRTQAGFVDTDAYIIFFIMSTLALLYLALKSTSMTLKILLAITAGISIVLFQWAWGPSWFFILFTFAALLATIGFEILRYTFVFYFENKHKNNNKNSTHKQNASSSTPYLFEQLKSKEVQLKYFSGAITGVFYFITIEIINIFFRQRGEILTQLYSNLFSGVQQLTTTTTSSIWPNVLSSVAELQDAAFNDIFSQLISGVGADTSIALTLFGLLGIFAYLNRGVGYSSLLPKYNSNVIFWGINAIVGAYLAYILFGLSSLTVNNSIFFVSLLFLPIIIVLIVNIINHHINTQEVFIISLISIWFAGGLFMSLNGTRFILLLAPAFTILVTFGIYKLIIEAVDLLRLEFKNINAKTAIHALSIISFVILYSIISPQIDRAYAITSSNTPNFDDAWFDLMEYTQENTSEDAIINSWWDFGHFFAAIGERGVTFDGGSQGTPASYWTGNWLKTNSELRATNILQMLSCSLNQGFEKVDSIFIKEMNDKTGGVHAFEVIDTLMNLNSQEQRKYLEEYERFDFSQEQIDSILNLIKCENPRQMLAITSGDMIQKAGVWAHWGSWDPNRKYVLDNYNSMSTEEISLTLEINHSEVKRLVQELEEIDRRANNLGVSRNNLQNQWLAPYPSYLNQPIQCELNNMTINCQDQLLIDLTNRDNISVEGQITNQLDVSRIILPTQAGVDTITINDKEELDLVVTIQEGSAQVLPTQYPLGDSMFTKLYFLDGHSLNNFEKLTQVNTQTASRVSMWNVNFDSNNTTSSSGIDINSIDIVDNGNNTIVIEE